ncbi:MULTISPECIES: flagellar hook-associated protein FlgL [Clostridium]|uniref:Flagellar hook-associated protein FlgL n=1 Tax=Clostridium aquiflavi TaxID=3073603 RepID=A0ABU1EDT0_9CLOT|nr:MULTISPECIES: flagellar hook-associated protein FlgL [unclassified Clostridium]MDR5586541.1 flagellar hook-associated protein FlgL [Clostridium sp. 5N-1]NFG60655.1 flagellar hook-associated protein 3 [Clostridium botulinum]NFQ10559.1 flagellar hook-associated protein 3 [Clostridium botulinum]
MRITTSMLASNYKSNMTTNLNHIQKIQNQLSSGKEISRPSDNPYKVSRTMQMYTEIGANKQYNENIKDISNWLDTTDTSLNQMGNVFARVRELLVTAGNGGYGPDEKKAIQDEIKERVNEMGQILNTNFDGVYIFGGTKSTSKPIMVNSNGELCYADKDGNAVSKTTDGVKIELTNQIKSDDNTKVIKNMEKKGDNIEITIINNTDPANPKEEHLAPVKITAADGKPLEGNDLENAFKAVLDSNGFSSNQSLSSAVSMVPSFDALDQIGSDLNVEVSQGVLINYNKNAVDILEGNGTNVMNTLNKIITNLGAGGDKSKITGECLGEVDDIIKNLLQNRSEVGAMQNRMESAQDKNESENLDMTDILSKTEDIDFTEKMIQYSIMQTVYMAALQTSAKILPATILDYL